MTIFRLSPLIGMMLFLGSNLPVTCGLNVGMMMSSKGDSRRAVVSSILTSAAAALVAAPHTCLAAGDDIADRTQLLAAIQRKASDDEVIDIIHRLQDPSGGKAATLSDSLDGQWELIWAYKVEAFSPLLTLPRPFRPDSVQYLGSAAATEVGEGRIAQGLTGGVLLSQQLWLSSAAVVSDTDPSVLEIRPPFRLQLGGRYGSNKSKSMLVEAGSDADFRQVNGRDKTAQAAGKNQYQQLYLEADGPGSLRVSSVIDGDPVIVGLIFVHRKL